MFLALATAVYAWLGSRLCIEKAFWFDELYTYRLAAQPSIAELLSGLREGMDAQPPLDSLLRHASLQVFGTGELALRLPSLLALYIAFVCLVWLGSRMHSGVAGILAGTMLFLGDGYGYLMEARPYAIVLALTALCCVQWRLLAERDYESPLLWFLLGATQSLALAAHYYACGLLFCVGLAVLMAFRERRRFLPGAILMAIPLALAALWLLPYASATVSNLGSKWWSPAPSIPSSARVVLTQFSAQGFWLVTLLALAVLIARGGLENYTLRVRPAEITLLAAILLVPFFHYLLANFVTHAYVSRYSLFALIAGCLLSGALLASRIPAARGFPLLIAACGLLLIFFQLRYSRTVLTTVTTVRGIAAEVAKLPPGDIVVPSIKDFLQIHDYSDAPTKARLVLLYSDPHELRLLNSIAISKSLRLVCQREQIGIKSYEDYIATHDRLLLLKPRDPDFIWIDKQLRADGFTFTLAPADSEQILFVATRPRR